MRNVGARWGRKNVGNGAREPVEPSYVPADTNGGDDGAAATALAAKTPKGPYRRAID